MPSTLRLYTDFVCPFCFIAEESSVPRLLREYDLELEWRGFELHPGTPKGGAVAASPNDLGGYSVMQAESKEALAAKMREHPHFMMPDGWIEIVDIMAVPGM